MTAPAVPLPASPIPGVLPHMLPPEPDPRRALAARLADSLYNTPKGKTEDRNLVQLFQSQEGLKPSGYYGAATALALAVHYGIVPPKPIHWPKDGVKKAKANYRGQLAELARKDPHRAEEWQRAAEV